MTANTRLKVGLAFAIGGNLLFFTGWWFWMPWSVSVKAALTAVLFFAPEAGTLICLAIIGKENYERFKNMVLDLWRQFKAGKEEGEGKAPVESEKDRERKDEENNTAAPL
ncbi:MAG: hypothetical protein JWO89_1156 [Verrucomicrobiaceae bacterium]|nr:hypothetical protein [Verrucomicrobiaceae bacterium]